MTRRYDAVVVGSGPNGLAAAIALAQAGCRVLVREGAATIGGGTRTAELTLPGFRHDVCSTAHPMGVGSPFFRTLPLAAHGLEWVHAPAPLAHPLDDGTAVVLERSVQATAAGLGADGPAYRRLFEPLVKDWEILAQGLLRPLAVPRHPVALARFGLLALRSAKGLAAGHFHDAAARALFAGMAAHGVVPLDQPATAAVGLVLMLASHAVGMPVARGGSQAIADALASYLRSLGGTIETGAPVQTLADLPAADLILCDTSPRGLLRLAGDRLPAGYRRQLSRFRYGPAAFKLDFALDGPIPWRAAGCARAAVIHLGGTLPEITRAERAPWHGRTAAHPYVIVVQASLFDDRRAPAGQHTGWAYCHVPNGSTTDMTARIEAQIERFAPGFRDRILARHSSSPAQMAAYNPNYVGGDINSGAQDIRQLFTRPVPRFDPYSTPVRGLYLCSSSTPPGGGVHGMCGYWAAQSALRNAECGMRNAE